MSEGINTISSRVDLFSVSSREIISKVPSKEFIYSTEWYYEDKKISPVKLAIIILYYFGDEYGLSVFESDNVIWYYDKDKGYYVPDGEKLINTEIAKILQIKYNSYYKREIIDYILTTGILDKELESPPLRLINLQNGILDISTNTLLEHTPKYHFFNQIPIEYNPEIEFKDSEIDKHIQLVLPKSDDRTLLQEIFGFTLFRQYFIEKVVIFHGGKGTGKSTTINILQKMLGDKNVSHVPLQKLKDFNVQHLKDKHANMFSDLNNDAVDNAGWLKLLSGNDTHQIELKHSNKNIDNNNYAKLIFSCNDIPQIRKIDDAYFDRMCLISFNTPIRGESICDRFILDKLTTNKELSGLLNWSVEGLQRLLKNENFSYSETTEQVKLRYLRNSNSALAFVYEYLHEVDSKHTMDKWVLYENMYNYYQGYCERHSIYKLSKTILTKTIQQQIQRAFVHTTKADSKVREWRNVWTHKEISKFL